jgi:hypothetical protein
MKKFLGILAIATVTLVACNDSADGTDATADSLRQDSIERARQDSLDAANMMLQDTTGSDTSGTTGDTTLNP